MGLQDISLPVDVPWTLIATSNDMLANHDTRFPHAMWKSSLAIFKYDPNPADLPDADEYKDRALTFLKVVCSITSYAPPCGVCPPPPPFYTIDEDFGSHWQADYDAWKIADQQCQNMSHQTYPCSGALVQVAIYPKKGDTTDVKKLAYFAAFEPKKRELIEAATESGESVTQSKSDVNIRKGVTSTNSTEDLDVFTGANLNVGVSGVSVGAGVTGQWGTIKKSGSQHEDVTTSDASRELREGSSHSTSLSQLYHLLNSYHLGTNRSIFFLQSRPHTLQQKDRYTFIDGPQEIEGVQEFFLVVSRPKDQQIDDYCVDGLLYTGHLDDHAMQNALMEPKTAETPWIDLWATAPPLPHGGGGLSWWKFLIPIPIPGVNDPITLTKDTVQEIQNKAGEIKKMWDDQFANQPANVNVQRPAIVDGYLTPAALNDPKMSSINTTVAPPMGSENGWRIDRTRGLGGYDLWEDPNNRSADSRGKYDNNNPPAKPQAFVDIVSSGSPDDLLNYHPDYALRVRAYAWPWGDDNGQAIYHGRIKAYFIRNDLPTTQRTVDMFVTVRGVSTCGDSPFFDYAPNTSLKFPPEIATETKIHPPSVAPWQSIPSITSTSLVLPPGPGQNTGGKDTTLSPTMEPINSARPSGLDHVALGESRAKMANAVGSLVQRHLVSSLRCLPERKKVLLYPFNESDLYFNRTASVNLRLEINRLAAVTGTGADTGLSARLLSHPALLLTLGPNHPAVSVIRQAVAAPAARKQAGGKGDAGGRETVKAGPRDFKPSDKLPVLTLASRTLTDQDRHLLKQGGVQSGLDLVNQSAADLARRLGTDISDIRKLRLRVLGLLAATAPTQD